MDFQHETLVAISKSYGLFYLIAMSIVVVIYACWPSNADRFDHAAKSVLDKEDKPCQ